MQTLVDPLNVSLYNALVRTFRHVSVSNEAEAMLASYQRDYLGRWTLDIAHHGESYRASCPFCGDTRQRLWICHGYGQLDPDGRPLKHLATCFNENCLADADNRDRLFEMVFGFRNRNCRESMPIRQGVVVDEPLAAQSLPGTCVRVLDLPPGHPVKAYLFGERGLSTETVHDYDLHYCTALSPGDEPRLRRALNRIIIPITMNGMLVGWQGRYVGTPPDGRTLKYFTCPGTPKRKILYNFDVARWQPWVILCEGPSDVWRLGPSAVAILGKTLSSQQRQLIAETWADRPVFVVLDSDAWDASQLVAAELISLDCHRAVITVQLPVGADPGSLPTETTWDLILRAADNAGVRLTLP